MAANNQTCPACGARLELENRFQKIVHCAYCGSVVEISNTADSDQEVILNSTPSRFSVGKTGICKGKKFTVKAHIAFAYEDGSWDEYLIRFEDSYEAWLQEDEGTFTLFHKESITSKVPKATEVNVGETLEVNGQEFFVTEKSRAVIASVSGTLPYKINRGEACDCLDGNVNGEIYSIEYFSNEISLNRGENVNFDDIIISND